MRQARSSNTKGMVEIDHHHHQQLHLHHHHHNNNHNKNKLIEKEEDQPHLSGAYIRSLVKQLTSSSSSPSSSSSSSSSTMNQIPINKNKKDPNFDNDVKTPNQNQNQNQPHKKQVRRRLHTTRPYQERLLNMAEARREIVTALKFHRAAMKQQQQQSQPPPPPPPPPPSPPPQTRVNSNLPCFEEQSKNPFYSYLPNPYPNPNPYSFSPIQPQFNFPLPNQTLGLNLNFQDFNNIDTTLYYNNNSAEANASASATTTSSASTVSMGAGGSSGSSTNPGAVPGLDLHAAMDDEEMAEIRSIGEQHQMEWSDTMNLVTSAWWFKFLRSMENESNDESHDYCDDGVNGFKTFDDEVMEFPAWLSSNEAGFDDHHCYFSDEFSQAPALPCMDIEEIEGMDEDWLG
ncbi:hypothetical protein CsatA_028633 [Cannabis sativa]